MRTIAEVLEPAGSAGEPVTGSRDVVFSFFGTAWSGAANRDFVMPEDRLAAALLDHPHASRVLVCSPYRSVAGRTREALRPVPGGRFPASADQRHFEPLRLRRGDPPTLGAALRATSAGCAPPRSEWASSRRR